MELFLLFILMFVTTKGDHINMCDNNGGGNTDYIGPWNINDYNDIDPGNTADLAYLRKTAVDCCGVLNDLDVEVHTAGTVHLHVWRPTTGNSYTLVGQTSTTCNNNWWNGCSENFGGAERVTVIPGDYIGWWASTELVQYETNNGVPVDTMVIASPTTGQEYDWSAPASSRTSRQYAIRIRLDRNDRPTLSNLPGTASLSETEAVGFSIFSVAVSDTDDDDEPILDVSMAANTYFTFDTTTREVSVAAVLGPASSPQTLTFTVTDICHRSDTETLTVTIINEPPVIHNLPNSATIHENTETEVSLFTVYVTDSFDPVTCSINSVSPGNGGFQITQGAGVITDWDISTTEGSYFDYDASGGSHTLTIRCSDGDDNTDGQFTVYLTPNALPIITNLPNSTSLHEDTSTEELLYTLTVTDADSPTITCGFGPGTSPQASASFRVRQKTGTSDWGIYSRAGVTFSYNSVSEFVLDIECSDGRDNDNEDFTVYLVRNVPPWLTNLPDSVDLSTNAPIGYTVFEATAADNENDQLSFYITCSPPGCPLSVFDSGHIQLNADISGNTNLVGYDVDVLVGDHRNNGTSRTLTITFVDINDYPEIQNLGTTINVPENNAINDPLVTTVCTDFDPSDTLTYSMTCTPAAGTTYFMINSLDGAISTSSSVINYEALNGQDTFSCDVTCSDGLASDVKTLTIAVTDVNEAPVFAQAAFSLYADEGPMGTQLQNTGYSVNDPDAGESKMFSLDCGSYTGYFTVATSTGITSYTSDYDVDTGIRPMSLTCTLTVTDSGGLFDTVEIDITINNINDNDPVFSPTTYSFFVSYYAPVSTNLGQVTSTDGDIGAYGQLTFTIDQTNLGDDYFGVSQDGTLYLNSDIKPLGYGSTVNFEVLATDGGGTESRAPVTVVISSTTTTSTTTTTDRFRTFFEDSRNIGWFAAAMVGILVAILVSLYIVFTYFLKRSPSLTKLACRCCRMERVSLEPKNRSLPRPSSIEKPPRQGFNFWSMSTCKHLTI